MAFCGGVGCQIHSRVERASFLDFVEGTRKTFAAANASFEPVQVQLCNWARKRGQAGSIEFLCKKSIHLSSPEHKRFFVPVLEGIRV